MHGETLKLWFI